MIFFPEKNWFLYWGKALIFLRLISLLVSLSFAVLIDVTDLLLFFPLVFHFSFSWLCFSLVPRHFTSSTFKDRFQPHFMPLHLPSFLLSGMSASLGYPATPVLILAFSSRNSGSVHIWLHTPIVLEGFFCIFFSLLFFPTIAVTICLLLRNPCHLDFLAASARRGIPSRTPMHKTATTINLYF